MTDARDAGEGLSADVCLTLLSNAHRRAALLSIYDRPADGGPIPVEEAVPCSTAEPVAVTLNHNHLPKLQEHGVIRWDREAETVAEGPAFGGIEPFVDLLDDDRARLPDDWRSGSER
ncbi:DUF7344 domain-containing protein [Halorubrum depositum]|uniref:DUF7344 domain-containing protein n=1 Tax=Halorubrum depositum TaxID=2583992 RepID=UPI0011A69BC8|nr:hypothetical protein [Halorubrum depositum]